jgi:hypothetical protein
MLKTIPFPSGVAILSHVGKIRAASAGDFIVVTFCFDWFVGVAT